MAFFDILIYLLTLTFTVNYFLKQLVLLSNMWNVSSSCDFPAWPFPVFEERLVQVKYKSAPYLLPVLWELCKM